MTIVGSILLSAAALFILTAAGTSASSQSSSSADRSAGRNEDQQPRGADGSLELPAETMSASPVPKRKPTPGEMEMQAVAAAYPDRVEQVELKDGAWAAFVDGRWYYWSGGRLLHEGLRSQQDSFTPIRFYNYYRGPLRIREIAPELEARLKNIFEEREEDPPVRHPGFQDALYGISSYNEAASKMEHIEFFGHRTRMHPIVVEALSRVEADIREASSQDSGVAEFIAGLSTVEGFNWRDISGTRARSLHSYGIAIDLIPQYYGGDFGYWKWAAQAGIEEWWNLNEDDRFTIPQPIVDSFERHGFVWGGKWLFFDPIHFEYRPEVFILSARE